MAARTLSGSRSGCARECAAQVVRKHSEQPKEAFPGKGKMTAQDAEIARLRKEVAKLKLEWDLLKKAVAYFAKESI